tara:strand:- start:481 stop:696 length:216 start_codon:yes stop_codon:yes gene_type:complete
MCEFTISGVLIPAGIEIKKLMHKMLEKELIPICIQNDDEEYDFIREQVINEDNIETQGLIHFISYIKNFEA